MKTSKKSPKILNRGSLLTYHDNGAERCFGYMFDFPGHGVFEPSLGKLRVSTDEAKAHNKLLSRAEIHGLDSNCAVGMRGSFHTKAEGSRTLVVTWLGEEVSRDIRITGRDITFMRKGMTFRGRLRQGEDWFGFKRIH